MFKPLSQRERGWGEGQRSDNGELPVPHSAALLRLTCQTAKSTGFQLSLE